MELQLPSRTVDLRPLGLGDIYLLRELVEAVLKSGVDLVGDYHEVDLSNPADLVAVVLAGGEGSRRPLVKWIASLLSLTPEEVEDPAKFGLDDLGKLLEALGQHPQAQAFFASLRTIAAPLVLKATRLMGRASSTNSKPATAGMTTTSTTTPSTAPADAT